MSGTGSGATTLPGFAAYGEFHGYTDTCGPDAVLMGLHSLAGVPLDAAHLNGIRAWLLARGRFTPGAGTTLANLAYYLTETRRAQVKIVGAAGTRAALDAAAGRVGVVLFVGVAARLPHNEPGVNRHFVAVGGVGADGSYLVGNGDDTAALGGHGVIPTRAMSWPQIAAAQPLGLLAFALGGGPVPYREIAGNWIEYENGARLGPGMAAYVRVHGVTETPTLGTTYLDGNTAICLFPALALVYDKASNSVGALTGPAARALALAYGHTPGTPAAEPSAYKAAVDALAAALKLEG